MSEFNREKSGEFSGRLKGIIRRPVTEEHVCLMAKSPDLINKSAGVNEEVNPVHAEAATFPPVSVILQETGFPFDKGKVLVEGLSSRMIPLIQGVQDGIEIRDNVTSLLRPGELKLYGPTKQVCEEVDTLGEIIDKGKIIYLTVYFMVSVHRMKNMPYKQVLLVCKHGYGTATMLKESLFSGY